MTPQPPFRRPNSFNPNTILMNAAADYLLKRGSSFAAFVRKQNLGEEIEGQVLAAGEAVEHQGHAIAENAMKVKLLQLRPDLEDAVRNHSGHSRA